MNKINLTYLLVGANAVVLIQDQSRDRDLWEDPEKPHPDDWFGNVMYDINRWAEKAVSDVLNTLEDIGVNDVLDTLEDVGNDIADYWE